MDTNADSSILKQELLPKIAEALKAIAHPIRLKILMLLDAGEFSVQEIQTKLGLQQAIVSQHLRVMRQVDIVRAQRIGNLRVYELANPGMKNMLKCLEQCQEYCIRSAEDVAKMRGDGNG